MPDTNLPKHGHDRAADPAAPAPENRAAHNRATTNRANTKNSTGPRTPAGKQRSSLNALRHGLTGQTIVLPTEDLAAYQRHAQSFLDEYHPHGATETQLVQSIIDLTWRLNRAAAAETNLLTLGITEYAAEINTPHPDTHDALALALAFREHNRALANISMYSQRYHRQFERTLAQLRQLQEERRTAERLQLDAAASLLEMHKEDGLPYNPADDGFVFSTSDIEAFIHHNNRLDEAMERACAASS
jgi:hypothetical protein